MNNYQCFSEDKCIFLHYLADPSDVIKENDKFGYAEHLKLAKKIIAYDSYHSKCYIKNNKCNIKTKLPSIDTIYTREEVVVLKTKEKKRMHSGESKKNNNSLSSEMEDNASVKEKEKLDPINNLKKNKKYIKIGSCSTKDNENEIDIELDNNSYSNKSSDNENYSDNNIKYDIFKPKSESRFFSSNSNTSNSLLYNLDNDLNNICFNQLYQNYNEGIINSNNNDKQGMFKNYSIILDNLLCRLSFFTMFNNYISFEELEKQFCKKLYNKTSDEAINEILKKIY